MSSLSNNNHSNSNKPHFMVNRGPASSNSTAVSSRLFVCHYQPQAQFYDPYQRQVIMQQANFASPSQYPIQQPYSFANGMTNMAQFHPQTLTSHSDFDQQQMQQSTQPSQQVQVQVQIQPQSNLNLFPAEQKRGRRFRRRFNQIERKYPCSFPGCQKSYGSLNHLNTHIVTKSMVTENQKLISNILFNQKKKTNHQKFHNTFSLVMITLLETIGMGTLLICDQPLRQHPRKVIRSIRSKYRSSHNNNSSSSHSNKTIATIICTIKVSSNPLLMLRLLVGNASYFYTYARWNCVCISSAPTSNSESRICLYSASAKNGNGQYGLLSATRGSSIFSCTSTVSLRNQ